MLSLFKAVEKATIQVFIIPRYVLFDNARADDAEGVCGDAGQKARGAAQYRVKQRVDLAVVVHVELLLGFGVERQLERGVDHHALERGGQAALLAGQALLQLHLGHQVPERTVHFAV